MIAKPATKKLNVRVVLTDKTMYASNNPTPLNEIYIAMLHPHDSVDCVTSIKNRH